MKPLPPITSKLKFSTEALALILNQAYVEAVVVKANIPIVDKLKINFLILNFRFMITPLQWILYYQLDLFI
jgi:hypothetical protein